MPKGVYHFSPRCNLTRQSRAGVAYRAGKSDTPVGIVVAKLQFPFHQKYASENSDDPRVRGRWRWATGISMGLDEMEIRLSPWPRHAVESGLGGRFNAAVHAQQTPIQNLTPLRE